jgi:sugar phosphate permease
VRYRWAVLAAGTAAQTGAAVFGVGLPVIAPTLQSQYGLSIAQVGLLLAAPWVGATVTLLPWGLAADRFGERTALGLGLGSSALLLVGCAYAPTFHDLIGLLALAGAAGSSVQSASGRAVMQWFAADERGLALGIRQTSIPLGGLVAALTLPPIASSGGTEAAFVYLAVLSGAGALAGGAVIRTPAELDAIEASTVLETLRDGRLWRLCFGGGIYLYAQVAITGFGVLFLHDEHGLSEQSAALVFAASQIVAVGLRIAVGRWSDVLGSRVVPLRRVGVAISGALVLTAALVSASLWLLVPVLALAGGLTMAWNGLVFTAAAELAGPSRSGAAIGFQQTMLSAIGVAAPVLFAATVSRASWALAFLVAAAFPLAGRALLRTLRDTSLRA